MTPPLSSGRDNFSSVSGSRSCRFSSCQRICCGGKPRSNSPGAASTVFSSGRSSPTFHSILGKDTPRSSSHCKYSAWLSDPFKRASSAFDSQYKQAHPYVSRETNGYRHGSSGFASQGRNTGSKDSFTELCLQHFSSSEKGWRNAPHNQSQAAESAIYFRPPLPHGYSEGCVQPPSSRGLLRLNRPQGRLLSCPNSPKVSSSPQICMEGESLRVSCSSIRTLHSPVCVYKDLPSFSCVSPVQRDPDNILFGRYPGHRKLNVRVSVSSPVSNRHTPERRVCSELEEVLPDPSTAVSFSGTLVGHSPGSSFFGRTETGFASQSGFSSSECGSPVLSGRNEASRIHDSCNPCSPSHTPPLPATSEVTQQCLQDLFGSSPPPSPIPGGNRGTSMGSEPVIRCLPSPYLASDSGGCGSDSRDGCLESGMGHILSRSDGEWSLGCECPSPYKCEGAHGANDLPPGLPPFRRPPSQYPSLGDRFNNSPLLHSERRGDAISSSPRAGHGDFDSSRQPRLEDNPSLCSFGREPSRRLRLPLQVSSGPSSSPTGFQENLPSVGATADRPVCFNRLGSTSPICGLGGVSIGGGIRCSISPLEVSNGLFVPPSPSHSEGLDEAPQISRKLHPNNAILASPILVPRSPSAERTGGSSPSSPSRFSGGPSDRPPSTSTQFSSSRRLDDFRNTHGLRDVNDSTFQLVKAGWRGSSNDRYERAWSAFLRFLRTRRIQVASVSVKDILEYLSLLYSKGLSYSTLNIHRSAISMTLPQVDGAPTGQHPMVKRLMKGVFNQRPPSRRLYPSWNASDVVKIFEEWPSPPQFKDLIRKTAFLLAMASARRPSELASFRISPQFFSSNATSARFVPTRLSKTDRPDHMGPAIIVYRLADCPSLCPVKSTEELISARSSLDIHHDFLFCADSSPYAPLSTSAFSRRISWVLQRAGVSAPPGSTRAMSASAAFSGSLDLGAILRAGDWSGADTFFRFYCRDLGVSQ